MNESLQQLIKRSKALREIALRMAFCAGTEGAHIGPAFSIMDIMNVLFFDVMQYRTDQPQWDNRDRLILSKGHACLGLYAPLLMSGFITQEQAFSFNQVHTRIAGHPSGKNVYGIEHPAGSLGHGLSVGCGMAKAAKLDEKSYQTYVILGDGETNEGSIWEAVMFAAQHRLDNLTAIVDANGWQYGGKTIELMNMEPMRDRWSAFGWDVHEVDGHDIEQLQQALCKKQCTHGKPICIIARTIKGHGVAMFENNNDWHHGVITHEVLVEALKQLESGREC